MRQQLSRTASIALLTLSTLALAHRSFGASTRPELPLADQVPAGVVFYLGWAGQASLGDAWSRAKAAQLLASLDLSGWTEDGLYKMLDPQAAGDPATPVFIELLRSVMEYAWKFPSAVYSNGPGLSETLEPAPHLCFLVRFPDDAEAAAAETDIQDRISSIVGGQPIPNVRFFRQGSTLAMSVNDTSDVSPLAPLAKPLALDPAAVEAFAQCRQGGVVPAAHAYLNLERIWTLVDENNLDDPNHERNMTILGLRKARTLALTAGLSEGDWASTLYIHTDPDRTGVLGALMAPRVADAELLARVPASAVSVLAFTVDGPDVLRRLQTEGERVSRGFSRQVLGSINLIGAILGVSSMDLLRNLGPQFLLYALPAEGTGFSYVLLTRPQAPDQLATSLFTIAQSAGRILLAQRPDLPMVVTNRIELAGRPVFTVAAGPITLAWTVVDDCILMTTGTDSLERASQAMNEPKLAGSPEFRARLGRLNAPSGATLGFSQLPQTIETLYNAWSYAFTRQIPNPNPRLQHLPLPDAPTLRAHATPLISALWTDDTGIYYRTLGPFPGADVFSANFALLAGPESVLENLRRLRPSEPDDGQTQEGSRQPGQAPGAAGQGPGNAGQNDGASAVEPGAARRSKPGQRSSPGR